MNELPMPSDLPQQSSQTATPEPIEPPSVKLIVRLFLIPLMIVALAVSVMFVIGRMAGSTPSFDEALARLKNPGGQRTADVLIGPGAKQRYLDAKALVDQMKKPEGMTVAERVNLSTQLTELLEKHVKPEEGEVQHFVLLALGRTWQPAPRQEPITVPDAVEARSNALDVLLKFAGSENLSTRKAAVLAVVYFSGNDEVRRAIPVLIGKLADQREDLDVRLAAATVLGPISSENDKAVVDALHKAMQEDKPENVELVWQSALSLAQLNQPDVADTILMLLSRDELSQLKVYDRETDPKNPVFRKLTDAEQQRILINTMIGAIKLNVPSVRDKIADVSKNDPSTRVRAAGMEVMRSPSTNPS